MSIPADFRRVLEAGDPEWNPGGSPRMYLLYGEHLKDQLHGYTVEEFDAVAAQIKALPRGSKAKERLSTVFLGQSIKLDIDKDGRTVMPIRQRQKLGVTDGELYFSGVGDHFKIFRAEVYAKTVAEDIRSWLDGEEEGFDPLSLLDG